MYYCMNGYTSVVHQDIKRGDHGDAVRFIQNQLAIYFMDPGNIYPALYADAIFGPKTQQAVRSFQSMVGLPITGVVDKLTWAQIYPIKVPHYQCKYPMQC